MVSTTSTITKGTSNWPVGPKIQKELGLKNAWSLAVEAVLPPQWESEVVSRLMKEKT